MISYYHQEVTLRFKILICLHILNSNNQKLKVRKKKRQMTQELVVVKLLQLNPYIKSKSQTLRSSGLEWNQMSMHTLKSSLEPLLPVLIKLSNSKDGASTMIWLHMLKLSKNGMILLVIAGMNQIPQNLIQKNGSKQTKFTLITQILWPEFSQVHSPSWDTLWHDSNHFLKSTGGTSNSTWTF